MQVKRILLQSILLVTLCAAAAAPGYAALISNGSFEAPADNAWSGTFQTLPAGSGAITGWTVTFGSIDWVKRYWEPAEGRYSIDLNGNGLGQISQTFDTVVGQQYKVTFAMAGNPVGGEAVKDLLAVVVGGNFSDNFSFDTTGKTRKDMGWEDRSFLFTALTDLVRLQFTSLEGGRFGAAIDNVRLEAVPVPAAAWLLGTGLIGLAVLKRRRK